MAITAVCPGCQSTYQVGDALRDRKVRCKKCQQEFVVEAAPEPRSPAAEAVRPASARAPASPQAEEVEVFKGEMVEAEAVRPKPPRRPRREEEEDEDDRDNYPRRRPARREQKSNLPLILGLSLGGVVLLAGAGVGVWLLVSSGKDDKNQAPAAQGPGAPNAIGPNFNPGNGARPESVQKAARKVPVAVPHHKMRQLIMAGPGSTQALVYSQDIANRVPDRFDRCDLKDGRVLGAVEIPGLGFPQYFALSPDGTRLAVQKSSIDSRVLVWSLAENREVANFEAVGSAVDKNRPFEKNPAYLAFLDADRLLVVNGSGGRTLWKLPGKEEVYSHKPVQANLTPNLQLDAFNKMPKNLALSADRKTLALFNGDGFDVFETDTGKHLRKTAGLKGDGNLGNFWGTAFNPAGDQLACFCQVFRQPGNKQDTVLVRWDVKTGAKVGEASLKWQVAVTTGLSWWGPNHVLLWNGQMSEALLIDVSQGKYVRDLNCYGSGRGGGACPEGRLWYLTRAGRGESMTLVGVDLPGPEALQAPTPGVSAMTGVGEWFLLADGIDNQRPRANQGF